ncbi:MAG: PEPxxWA-CTERM sorting domain-containing protein [Sphingomonadaceae bacterium]
MARIAQYLAGAALALASIAPAHAVTVLSDTFNTEAGGGNALNYNSFANFNVIGQVDVVAPTNGFGITVPSSVVDLDGSSGPGAIESKLTYAFNAGDLVTLSLVAGGAQRGSRIDDFFVRLLFGAVEPVTNLTGTGYLNGAFGSLPIGPTFTFPVLLSGSDPFGPAALSFIADTAGSFKFQIVTNSADNIGPLLDSVTLDISGAVPEPATWAMMITGFGLAGTAMRRRRSAAAAFAAA